MLCTSFVSHDIHTHKRIMRAHHFIGPIAQAHRESFLYDDERYPTKQMSECARSVYTKIGNFSGNVSSMGINPSLSSTYTCSKLRIVSNSIKIKTTQYTQPSHSGIVSL